ncbi:MAG: hypothetical protein ACJ8F7_07055 [Gemmataceae bacterium]
MKLPSTADRVACNTADEINAEIRHKMEESVVRCATAGPEAIERRLAELDREWDIERYLETMAPSLTLLGLTLGLTVSKKFFVIPFAVQTFFLQHALQGWCPPIPVLRRAGVRTMEEINEEKNALKALRGDYQDVRGTGTLADSVRPALAAAMR